MKELTIGLCFLVVLAGILTGLYAGISLKYHLSSRDGEKTEKGKKNHSKKKRINHAQKKKRKMKKNKEIKSDQEEHPSSLLSERVPEKESFVGFVCDSMGENPTEHIEKIRKSQDQKYLNKTMK